MNRLLKITALLVIGILTARPVLSSLNCAVRMVDSCKPGCPMATNRLAANCPMSGVLGASGDCCAANRIEAVLPKAGHQKNVVAHPSPAAGFASALPAAGIALPSPVSVDFRALSHPRYIVNRVFRI
jgi:hypothetical protein